MLLKLRTEVKRMKYRNWLIHEFEELSNEGCKSTRCEQVITLLSQTSDKELDFKLGMYPYLQEVIQAYLAYDKPVLGRQLIKYTSTQVTDIDQLFADWEKQMLTSIRLF